MVKSINLELMFSPVQSLITNKNWICRRKKEMRERRWEKGTRRRTMIFEKRKIKKRK